MNKPPPDMSFAEAVAWATHNPPLLPRPTHGPSASDTKYWQGYFKFYLMRKAKMKGFPYPNLKPDNTGEAIGWAREWSQDHDLHPGHAMALQLLVEAIGAQRKAIKELLDATDMNPEDLESHREYEEILADAKKRARDLL